MRILYDNKVVDATVTVNSENPNYEIENLQDSRLSKVFRSLVDDINIVITGPITANYFSILNHNLTESATITLQGNNTNVWTSPTYSASVDWSEGTIIHSMAGATFNYWRVVIVDNDSNSAGYIEIGHLWLSTYIDLPYIRPDQELPTTTTSNVQFGGSGQVFGDIGYTYKAPKVNFGYLTDAQRKTIQTMFACTHNVRPIIVYLWKSKTDWENAMYCVIDQNNISFRRTDSPNMPWSLSLQFREVF